MDQYQMKNLYDSGNQEEIAALWQDAEEREQFSEWDYIYVMNTFYKQKDYNECLEVYRAFHKKYPDSDKLDDKMGWSCYHTKIKSFDFKAGDRNKLRQQAEYIISHSGQGNYSPKWFMVKYMLDQIKEGNFGQDISPQQQLLYLDQVDPESLSTDSETRTLENGRTIHSAYDREDWYRIRAKLLLAAEQYDECIDCCDSALQKLQAFGFHNDNDQWFRYRKAKSLFALGKAEEAGKYVHDIQARGLNHWCLWQLLFEMDRETGRTDEAIANGCKCALADPSHEMRIKFYEAFAEFLNVNGYALEAALHRQLVVLIRKENDWNLKERHLAWSIPEEIAAKDKQAVLKDLKAFWREWQNKGKTYFQGTVKRLLGEGKSGFIEADDGKNYYFNARDFQRRNTIPQEGMRVKFTLVDKLDKSKGVVKPNATDISII